MAREGFSDRLKPQPEPPGSAAKAAIGDAPSYTGSRRFSTMSIMRIVHERHAAEHGVGEPVYSKSTKPHAPLKVSLAI